MTKELKPITIAELKEIAKGEIVELPPFSNKQPFIARMRKLGLMDLMIEGKIPNILLEEVRKLFKQPAQGDAGENVSGETLSHFMEVIEILAKEAFIEPTWEEIKSSGVRLTEAQYTFIFNYTQGEVADLTNFRK